MGYPATVQKIERKKSTQAQWYVNFPNALAQTMNFEKGEEIEWEVMDIAIVLIFVLSCLLVFSFFSF